MIQTRKQLYWVVGPPLVMALAATGCASKKYVSQQFNQVNQNLGQYEKKTNDRIAWMNNKQSGDMAQVSERIAATDQKLAQVAGAAQDSQGAADRAMEAADDANIANEAALAYRESMTRPLNYEVVDTQDVMFGFDKANLTQDATSLLDEIAGKFESTPGAVIELAGFTDPAGSANYNLELSRRRAWAVQRYLVDHRIPVRAITVVGMGKTAPPAGLEVQKPPTGKAERDRDARRVNIRILQPGTPTDGIERQ